MTTTLDLSVLVLGAGELGEQVLTALVNHSQRGRSSVTVLLRAQDAGVASARKAAQAAMLKSLGVGTVTADVETASVDALAAVFRDYQVVVCCTGMYMGPGMQTKITQAVLDAGVERYIPWQFGVDYDAIGRDSAQDLFTEQLDVRVKLRAQTGTRWAVLSTGMFTPFLFEPAFGVVSEAQDAVHALGSWDTQVTVTAPEDIGRVVAELVFSAPDAESGVFFTAGDTVSYGDVAGIVEAAVKRPVERTEWPVATLLEQLQADPNDPLKPYRVVFAQGVGVAWPKADTFSALQGMQLITAREWAMQHLVAK